LEEFQKRCHYDLAEHLPSLYWDVGHYPKVRFDYWQTLHDLWKENYFRPLFQWCDRNQLQFTGHWMEHEWPYPWISPADASFYAYEHVPGIDMLEGGEIRTKGADPHMLFTIKQVASAAHQLGRRAFCEAYGVSGWDSTFEHYKRFGDWLMVHGVNFINPHLAFVTVRGARKRDHPQSFSDISPWWPYYRLHGDYLGRVSYMLSQGKAQNRLLILEPTTSGFLWARKGGPTVELAQLRNSYTRMIQFLADHQVDFDLVDEYILEWFGKPADRKLVVGKASYDLLVWPDHMVNLRHETIPLLAKYLEGGGEVLALSAPAAYVDGHPCADVKDLAQRYASQWHSVSNLSGLFSETRHRLEPRVVLAQEAPNVGLLERFLDNGDHILFFTNTGLQSTSLRATVAGGTLEQWDPVSGRIEPAPSTPAGINRVQFTVDVPPAGSRLFVARRETVVPRSALKPAQFTPLQAAHWLAQPDSANVLVLDYCDLQVAGMDISDINTWRANWLIWQNHGFDRPAWDNAVQFRKRVFDREPFPANSGFVATFRFQVTDPAVTKGLELALEVPELYQVSLNGQTVSFAEGTCWLDPRIRRTAVGHLTRPGENIITVRGQPFDVRMELENLYLLGAFGIVPGARGFSLGAAPKLSLGAWARQGYPFFFGTVLYETEVIVPDGKKLLRVELGPWAGSLAVISLDGKDADHLGWPPYSTELPISPGRHKVGVRVVATPRNLFGPFHNPAKLRMKAWPAAWAEFPEHQPPGSAYDVLDYGLMEPPTLSAGSSAMK
jgi:hypothetical protein